MGSLKRGLGSSSLGGLEVVDIGKGPNLRNGISTSLLEALGVQEKIINDIYSCSCSKESPEIQR